MANRIDLNDHNYLFEGSVLNHVKSFCDIIDMWAEKKPNSLAIQFIKRGKETDNVSYAEFRTRSLGIANILVKKLAKGSRVVLMFEQSIDYLCAFTGCLYAGMVAVTAFPPHEPRRNERLQAVIENCNASAILVNNETEEKIRNDEITNDNSISIYNVQSDIDGFFADFPLPECSHSTLAFLQYTSGSTSEPKGVMLPHKSLLSNLQSLRSGMKFHEQSVFVSWLPLYHDMGLIFAALSSLFNGSCLYLMSPEDFVRKPLFWLEAISKYRGTVVGAPDFAYRLCCDRITSPASYNLDLSSLEIMLSGSEPIRFSTVKRFYEHFKCCGIPDYAVQSGYGLAECSVYVSNAVILNAPMRFDRAKLEAGSAVPDGKNGREIVLCGYTNAVYSQDVRIVNPRTCQEVQNGQVGEIWVSGGSNGVGYWGKTQLSEITFSATLQDGAEFYLKTGDLGFIYEQGLYVCGRIKDLIIIRGRNIYPADICSCTEYSHDDLRSRPISAFSIVVEGNESLVVVIALNTNAEESSEISAAVKERVLSEYSVDVSAVVFVNNKNLHRTTSGKIQHSRVKRDLLNRSLPFNYIYTDESVRTVLLSEPTDTIESKPVLSQPGHNLDLEESIIRWINDVLNSDVQVNPEKNLFYYGLDSLKTTKLLELIQDNLNIDMSLSWFASGPTVNEIIDTARNLLEDTEGASGLHGHESSKVVELTI